jgi:hypothetical protein
MTSGLWLVMVSSLLTCWLHHTLIACLYCCLYTPIPEFRAQFYPYFLSYVKVCWAHTLSCCFIRICSSASNGHVSMMWSYCWHSLHLLFFVIIIIAIISFMQGIHTYIPETNHVFTVYTVAVILRALLMVHITLSAILNSFVLLH